MVCCVFLCRHKGYLLRRYCHGWCFNQILSVSTSSWLRHIHIKVVSNRIIFLLNIVAWHCWLRHRDMVLLVTSSWHGIAGYVVTDATCSRDQIWRHHVPFCETNVNCFIFTGWQLYLLPSESRYSVEFIILLYQYCSNCVAIFCYAYTSLRFLGVVRILPPWQWRYWQGGVAIGNSERHVRKASHGGSKQQ